jgi:hypothetical protein
MNDGWKNKKHFYFWWATSILEDVDMNNKGFELQVSFYRFVCYLYVLQVFDGNDIVVELCGNTR